MPELVKSKSRIREDDWDKIADEICQKLEDRKRDPRRTHLSECWKEIDRQLRLEPDRGHKMVRGKIDEHRKWMAETELPQQAQALEVLQADALRMMRGKPWFRAHAETTDEYLAGVDMTSLVSGDENEVPSKITQDNVDKLVHGVVEHWHRQTDFWGTVDLINGEVLRYGTCKARVALLTKQAFMHQAKGVVPVSRKIPVLLPRSIKKTYLDPSENFTMNEGFLVSPSDIYCEPKRLEDIQLMASKGSSDPNSFTGGWMAAKMKGLDGDDNGNIELVEYEGDLIIARKTRESIFLPNVIVTVAVGKAGGESARRVIRLRFVDWPFRPSLTFHYHRDDLESPYASSPLMKGRPVQEAAVDALNKLHDSAALKNQPPIGWDENMKLFAQEGGPQIYPTAKWQGGADGVKVHSEVGGDPTALKEVLAGHLSWHADVTGVNPPRLGAQTVSHTTAFAKDQEILRGQARTVDYVGNALDGPLTAWLYMAYVMGRSVTPEREPDAVWIDAYGGFVDITKRTLPERSAFEAFGSGGPQEEQQKKAERFQGLQMALQIDALRVQMGQPPKVDGSAAIEQILRESGWEDVDAITNPEEQAGGPGPRPGDEGTAQGPGATIAALQGIGAA